MRFKNGNFSYLLSKVKINVQKKFKNTYSCKALLVKTKLETTLRFLAIVE